MQRRAAGVLVAVLTWGLATTATAQTTTTSSSTSSSSTTTTVAPSTTTTTIPNRCAGQVCTDRPPAALIAGAAGEVTLDRGSSCWTSPAPNAQGFFVGVCADSFAREPDAVLVVRAGETLTLRFDAAMTPTFVQIERGGQATTLTPANPVRFGSDLPPGSYVVTFFTRWLQGDAGYFIRLDVRAAALPVTQEPRPLALTG